MNSEVQFKSIRGFPNNYISTNGVVINEYGRELKHKITKQGYHAVGLRRNRGEHRVWMLVARLILLTYNYIPGCEKLQAHHKDKDNNELSNLEWVTPKDNCNAGTRNAKCKQAVIKPIVCIETGIVYESAREASRQLGVNYGSISCVLHGKRNKAGGYHWRFV